MTVYVALPLPETFRAEISARLAAIKKVNQKYHWLDGQELRVTINFFGKMDAAGAGLVRSAVRLAAAGFGPFTMSVGSIGINWDLVNFSNKKVAVPWEAIFVEKGKKEMTALADKIDMTLAEMSKNSRCVFRNRIRRPSNPDYREGVILPLKPYITIVRMGRPRETIALCRGGTYKFIPMSPGSGSGRSILCPPTEEQQAAARHPFKPAPECLVQEAGVYVSGKLPDGSRRTTRTLVSLR